MTRAIRWTVRALRRLDQAGTHIAAHDPSAAARVVVRLVSAVELLADQPGIGRVGRIPGTRELVFADVPYIVAYRVRPTSVEILTVMHSAQKWPESL